VSRVFDHHPDVVVLGKSQPSGNIIGTGHRNGVRRTISKQAGHTGRGKWVATLILEISIHDFHGIASAKELLLGMTGSLAKPTS
jgi:hypothetical protein